MQQCYCTISVTAKEWVSQIHLWQPPKVKSQPPTLLFVCNCIRQQPHEGVFTIEVCRHLQVSMLDPTA